MTRNGTAQAGAAVKVLDANGLPVAGATVAGTWSGLVSRSSTATSGSSGLASFSSPTSRATSGSFNFKVTGVSKAGYNYLPASNTETSDSIAR